MRPTLFRYFVPGLLLVALTAAFPADARAQGFISPLVGFDFGGDSGCQTASGCEEKSSNIGVAFGRLGGVGYEGELAFARNFFGETPGTSSSVLTFMNNLLIAPKIGPVRPYFLFGVGLIKTRVELTAPGGFLDTSNNNFGWDLGGGVMVFFGDHIGVRGDLRRFRSFESEGLLSILPLGDEKLSFNRAAGAVVFAF